MESKFSAEERKGVVESIKEGIATIEQVAQEKDMSIPAVKNWVKTYEIGCGWAKKFKSKKVEPTYEIKCPEPTELEDEKEKAKKRELKLHQEIASKENYLQELQLELKQEKQYYRAEKLRYTFLKDQVDNLIKILKISDEYAEGIEDDRIFFPKKR